MANLSPTSDPRFIEAKLHGLAEDVAKELRKSELRVTLKIKKSNFEVMQRQLTVHVKPQSDCGSHLLLRKNVPRCSSPRWGESEQLRRADLDSNRLSTA